MAIAHYKVEFYHIAGRENFIGDDALSHVRQVDYQVKDCVVSVLTIGRGYKSEDGSSAPSSNADEIIWDIHNVRKAQDTHPMWGELKNFLRGEVSTTLKLSQSINDLHSRPNGIIYHIRVNAYGQGHLRVIVPESYRTTALYYLACCLPTSGYGEIQVTLERLKKFTFWPSDQGCRHSVSNAVFAFVVCC